MFPRDRLFGMPFAAPGGRRRLVSLSGRTGAPREWVLVLVGRRGGAARGEATAMRVPGYFGVTARGHPNRRRES